MSRFDADFYLRYRPLYPVAVFQKLFLLLRGSGRASPFAWVDVGCGTGQSTLSFITAAAAASILVEVTAVDPDPFMLAKARSLSSLNTAGVSFLDGCGEALPLGDASMDAVGVGSAFHWMNALRARDEFIRVLRPQGVLLVYEYQFPKCLKLPLLNEWVRREFNLRWKAPDQKPRGNFAEVTKCLRTDSRLRLMEERRVPMVLELQAADLVGLILSQSRVLHFQEGLSEERRADFQQELKKNVEHFLGPLAVLFDFSLTVGTFVLTT